MGTSGELVTTIATALDVGELGLSRESVFVAMRELRAANMIPVTGRGLSGATMTEREAAKLLIAVAGALQLKDSVETVRLFSALPLSTAPRSRPGPRDAALQATFLGHVPGLRPDLLSREPSAAFPAGEPPTFCQVLELVLRRARDRDLFFDVRQEGIVESERSRNSPIPSFPYLRITLERPLARASVAWGVLPYSFEELRFGDRGRETDLEHGYYRSYDQPRLVQERSVGLRAIESIGLFLHYSAEREERVRRRRKD